jgi:predicted metal-dependent peptidase
MVHLAAPAPAASHDARTHVGAAALNLVRSHPYLGVAVWGTARTEQPGLGTFAVDRRARLFYDPEVALGWSVAQVSAVLYHEACHVLRAHAERCPTGVDHGVWNLAADLEINDDLAGECGVALPESAVQPQQFGLERGLLAEAYVRLLPAVCTETAGSVAAGRCGSCAGGHDVSSLLDQGDLPPGLDEGELVVLRRRVAQAIRTAPDSAPGHWGRWAHQHLQPRVDWRREFASLIRCAVADQSGAVDYSYRRPSRRQAAFGSVIHPALRRPVVDVAMIVDTSGSMTEHDLALALAELRGVLQATCSSVGARVLSVDAEVQSTQRVTRVDQVALAGGGGTDMRAGFEAVERLRPRPTVLVVVTDGQTPWPARPPRGMSVIVALTQPAITPPWSKSVVLA